MEAQILERFPDRQPCKQAKDFAELALAHYNEKKKTVCTNLLINCHLNFACIYYLFSSQIASWKTCYKQRKFKLATTLLSKCFSESCGTTYGHVNFTAVPWEQTLAHPTSETKRLFFAELMLIPELQMHANALPMRVVRVCTIDDDSCYGKYFESFELFISLFYFVI
jgi:hypothetical protein